MPTKAPKGKRSGLAFRENITHRLLRGRLNEEQICVFQKCLDNCSSKKLPVDFCVPIGGYKKWRLPAFPEADWAELFHLSFMRDLAVRISSKYEPGVKITYIWDDTALVELNINQFPLQIIFDYCHSLQVLIDYFNSLCSGTNVFFSLRRMTEYYNRDRYLADFQRFYNQADSFWNESRNTGLIHELEEKAMIHYYCENGKPGQDVIRRSAQQIWAHSRVFFSPVFADTNFQIPVILRKGPPQYLHLRSHYTSEVQFWVGEGVIINGIYRVLTRQLSLQPILNTTP